LREAVGDGAPTYRLSIGIRIRIKSKIAERLSTALGVASGKFAPSFLSSPTLAPF
jgi:hypothetical protein